MTDGRKVQYLIELMPDTKQFEKIRQKIKAIDGGEFIKFEPSEVKKLKGILQGVVDDVGNRASSIGNQIQKGIAKGLDKNQLQKMLDVDTTKLIETMEIVEKLTGLIDDHSKGSSWLKDGKGFLGKLSGSQQDLRNLEQSIGKLELKFEGLDASLTSTIAKFDALATAIKSLQGGGNSVVAPSFKFENISKDIDDVQRKIDKLNDSAANVTIKITSDSNTKNVYNEVERIIKQISSAKEKIEELQWDIDDPDISREAEKKALLEQANEVEKLGELYKQLNKIKEVTPRRFAEALTGLGERLDPKNELGETISKLNSIKTILSETVGSSAIGQTQQIGIEIALPTTEDIRKQLNSVIDQLNKPNSLHKVKLEIDDVANVIEDKQKRAYGDNPADDDVKTTELVEKTEKRLDKVAQVIKNKQDAIFEATDDWRKKMINAMSINAKDLKFQFGLESNMENTADALFNKLQEYFEKPEYALDIKFNTEKIAKDLKAALDAEGIELGVGGGTANIDAKSLMSMLHSILYGGGSSNAVVQNSGNNNNSAQQEVADETEEATESSKEYVKVLDETTIHIDKVIESLRKFAKESNKASASNGAKNIAGRLTKMGIDIGAIKNGASDTDIIAMLQTSLMSKDKMGAAQGASLVGKLEGMMQTYKMDPKKGSGKVVNALAKDIMELFNINELETELEEELIRRFKQLEIWKGIEKPGKALAALGNVRSTKKKIRLPDEKAISDAITYFEAAGEDTKALKDLEDARKKFDANGQTEEAKAAFEKAALVFYDETKDVFRRLQDRWGDFKGVVKAEGRRPVTIDQQGAYPTRILEIPDDVVITKVDIFEVFKNIRDIGFTGSSARRESSQRKAKLEQDKMTRNSHVPNYIDSRPTPKKDIRYEDIAYDIFKTQESNRLPPEASIDASLGALTSVVNEIPEIENRIETSKQEIARLEEIKKQINDEISQMSVQGLPEIKMDPFNRAAKKDVTISKIVNNAYSAIKSGDAFQIGDVSHLDKEQQSFANRLNLVVQKIHEDSEVSQELADKIAEIVDAKKLSKQELEAERAKATEQGNSVRANLYRDLLFNPSDVDNRLATYQSKKTSADASLNENHGYAQNLINELFKLNNQNKEKAIKEAESLATQLIEIKDKLYAEAQTYVDVLKNPSSDQNARQVALGQLQQTLGALNQVSGKFANIQAYVPQTNLYNNAQQKNVDKWNKTYTSSELFKNEKKLRDLEAQLKEEQDREEAARDKAKIENLKKQIANTKRNITNIQKKLPENVVGKKNSELNNIDRQLKQHQSQLKADESRKKYLDNEKLSLQQKQADADFLTKYNELLEKEKSLLEEVNKLKREGVDESVIASKEDELKLATKALDNFLKKEKTSDRSSYARQAAVEYQAQLQTAYRKRSVFDHKLQELDDEEANLNKYGLSGRVGSRARRRALNKATAEYMSSDEVRLQEEVIRKNEQLSWDQRNQQLADLRKKLREEFAKKFDDTNVKQDELDRIATEREIIKTGSSKETKKGLTDAQSKLQDALKSLNDIKSDKTLSEEDKQNAIQAKQKDINAIEREIQSYKNRIIASREDLDQIIQDLKSQKKTAMRYGGLSDADLSNDKYLKQNEIYNQNIIKKNKELSQKQKELEDIKSDDSLDEKTQEKKIRATQKEIDAINEEIQRNQVLIDNRVKLMELHKQEKEESKQTSEERALLATEKLVGMKQSLAQAEEKVAERKAEYESAKGTENEIKMLEALDNQIKKRDKIQEQIAKTEQKIEHLGQVAQQSDVAKDEVVATVASTTSSESSGGLIGALKEAIGGADVNLTPVTEILQQILEILNKFSTEGIKKTGAKDTSEAKPKQSKKTEADLIRDNALKQHDVVRGLVAGRGSLYDQYMKDVDDLKKAVKEANAASETDKKKAIAKVKTKAQKVSALSYNILKNTSQWDYLVANSDSGAKTLNLKKGESLKDKMEIMAKKEHGILGSRGRVKTNPKYNYDFLGFDGDTLTYQLTDIEGKVRKVTMTWNEFTKQVVTTSDKTGYKLSELAGKVESFDEKFKNAVNMGYLSDSDEAYKDFLNKVEKIKEATTLKGADVARNNALQAADLVAKKVAQNKKLYTGTAEMNAATKQHGNLEASGILNKADLALVEKYKDKYEKLAKLHADLKSGKDKRGLLDENAQKELMQTALEAKQLGKELEKAYAQSERLKQLREDSGTYKTKDGQINPIGKEFKLDGTVDKYTAMRKALEELGATNIKVDTIHQKATGTIRHNDRVVSDLEVSYDELTGSLSRYHKQERESLTGVPAFINGFQKKFNSIMQYLSMTMSIHRILSEVRKGIQYVREIDDALVELRKVTDETQKTYDKFLQTAAKTGEKLGATISDVTRATATFAKLGYAMSDASEMAEAALVYKNVGDNIASAEDAADSIISTLKGFNKENLDAMSIVDRFNEVGNRFAITSQGIGEALKLSASALSEGGNTLDESIGIITAANEVVNDPSSVGRKLCRH